jgi:hypothetical protein
VSRAMADVIRLPPDPQYCSKFRLTRCGRCPLMADSDQWVRRHFRKAPSVPHRMEAYTETEALSLQGSLVPGNSAQ